MEGALTPEALAAVSPAALAALSPDVLAAVSPQALAAAVSPQTLASFSPERQGGSRPKPAVGCPAAGVPAHQQRPAAGVEVAVAPHGGRGGWEPGWSGAAAASTYRT